MSAGQFVTVGYPASYDSNQIHPIRVQPETLALAVTIASTNVVNAASSSGINTPISAVVSRGRRSKGLNARLIRVRFTSVLPEGYLANSVISLPALNPTLLLAPTGATGTYLGEDIEVIGTSPETVR
jgi:hypothetical protein